MSERPTAQTVREITLSVKVNDFVICPSRSEAARVARLLKLWDSDCITRSIMHNGKECVKVWRIR